MKNAKPKISYALMSALMLPLLTACGGGGGDTTAASTSATTSTAATTTSSSITTTSTTTTTTMAEVVSSSEHFKVMHSYYCLGETLDQKAVQTTCYNNVPSQLWRVTRIGGAYQLSNNESNRCLSIADGSLDNLAGAVTTTCDQSPQSLWDIVPREPDSTYVFLVNRNSGKCLEIAASDVTEGKQASQYDCGSVAQANQTWHSVTIVP